MNSCKTLKFLDWCLLSSLFVSQLSDEILLYILLYHLAGDRLPFLTELRYGVPSFEPLTNQISRNFISADCA